VAQEAGTTSPDRRCAVGQAGPMSTARRHHGDRARGGAGRVQQQLRSRPQGGLRPGHRGRGQIEAADGDRFTPATLELSAGEKVTIEITNTDDRAHDFAIEAANLNTGTIQPGAVATATFTVPEGTTEFVCTFHRGMTGTIQSV
jgi:plastocyanin